MLLSTRRAWACIGAGTVLGAGLFSTYLGMRALQVEPEPSVFAQLVGVAFVAACSACLATWVARRQAREALRELSDRVAALRQDSSLATFRSLSPEWGPLYDQLDTLVASYRQALQELVARTEEVEAIRLEQQQAEAALQSLVGRADAEQGRSLFHVRRGDNDSRNMVARLTPNLHWMVATPALQQFLGYSFRELNGRSFLDTVHPEDAAGLVSVLQEALETGEGHNITCRLLTRAKTEAHVQIDVLTRYSKQSTPLHLRCHFLDVTHRVETDRELRRLADALRHKAEELQQANTQLLRINRELDDFSYVVSHDLKEPLRTLQAFSNFLDQDYSSQLGPEGREFISHLIEASRRLGVLIDDLLTLSRAGKVLNAPRVFELGEVAETVRGDLADLILRKGAAVHVEGTLPAVIGDPPRVVQLLTNLVSNGLKYNTNPRPEVAIGQLPAGTNPPANSVAGASGERALELEYVTLYVRDNGIGIDPRYHEQIFRIFRRLHRREDYEGTGAGLAICKKIVEAHGGRIWVESGGRQGATFYFTLPRWQGTGSTTDLESRPRLPIPGTMASVSARLLAVELALESSRP